MRKEKKRKKKRIGNYIDKKGKSGKKRSKKKRSRRRGEGKGRHFGQVTLSICDRCVIGR